MFGQGVFRERSAFRSGSAFSRVSEQAVQDLLLQDLLSSTYRSYDQCKEMTMQRLLEVCIYIYILASVYLTSKVLGCCKGTLFVSQSQAADFVPPSSSLIFMG